MKIILSWLINTVAVMITAYLIPGVRLDGFWPAFFTAVFLGLVNAVIKPILIILTLPINILTLGLFTLVINAGMVLLVAKIIPGFSVVGFWPALWFSIVAAILNFVLNNLSREQTKI